MTKRNFGKDYKTPRELVTLLENRGLIINDRQKAQLYLESIGYYRLSAYMHPLLKTPKTLHLYKAGATFNKVMMLYRFDKKLRLLLFNEIEKIEIAVREAVMNMTAERTGDIYWLTNSAHFRDQSIFVNSMAMLSKEYERSTEDFIEHFKRTYTEPFPPAWILGELLPMGSVNMYYNACCHHARVWNKVNKIIPNDMRGMTRPWITIPADKRRIYYNMCIIKYFLDIISPNNDMLDKMHNLFSKFPEIDLAALGFPVGWEQEPLWIQANN